MSFGLSISDFITLSQLASSIYKACVGAGGEYREISREVRSLRLVLERLTTELEEHGVPDHRKNRRKNRELRHIVRNCHEVLQTLQRLVTKYTSLGATRKRLMDRFRFARENLEPIRQKLIFHITVTNAYINSMGLSVLRRLERQGDQFPQIIEAIEHYAAENRTGRREGSVLTTYSNDEKEIWKQFRRELISDGFNSELIRTYSSEIKAFVMMLARDGRLEEKPPDCMQAMEEPLGADTLDTEDTEDTFAMNTQLNVKDIEDHTSEPYNGSHTQNFHDSESASLSSTTSIVSSGGNTSSDEQSKMTMRLRVQVLIFLSSLCAQMYCIYMPHRKDLIREILVLYFALRRLKQVLEVTLERSPKLTLRDFVELDFLHRTVLESLRPLIDAEWSERVYFSLRDPSWREVNVIQPTLATCSLIVELEVDDKVEELEDFVWGEVDERYNNLYPLCENSFKDRIDRLNAEERVPLFKKSFKDLIDRGNVGERVMEHIIIRNYARSVTSYQKKLLAFLMCQMLTCLWDTICILNLPDSMPFHDKLHSGTQALIEESEWPQQPYATVIPAEQSTTSMAAESVKRELCRVVKNVSNSLFKIDKNERSRPTNRRRYGRWEG